MADPIRAVVPAGLDGERLDKALAVILGVSRTEAKHLVDVGVRLDGRPGSASGKVREGSLIETPPPRTATVLEPEPIEFEVILETDDYLVVDKPPGLVVHPGSARTRGTLAAGLIHRYPEMEGVGEPGRWGLVHRLDRDTSGVLLVARTSSAYEDLTGQLARREVKRTYTALVDGTFLIPTGTIEAPIGRDPARPTRRAVVPDGKHAVTHYEVETNYPAANAALLIVRLETGRTHQIRVHLAAIDHPVIGDRTYRGRPTTAASPRVFLHASRLEFADPTSGATVRARSPLPEDLALVLERLGSGIPA